MTPARLLLAATASLLLCGLAAAQPYPGWVQRASNAVSPSYAVFTHVTTDDEGNIYAVGNISDDSELPSDILVYKYNTSGVVQWARRINGSESRSDAARGVVVDSQRDLVYITARWNYGGTSSQIYTQAISADSGALLVSSVHGLAAPDKIHEPRDIAITASGEVYVIGETYGGATNKQDALVMKFGTTLEASSWSEWVQTYNGFDRDDRYNAATVDSLGNLYVAGFTEVSEGNLDAIVRRYNSSGVGGWTNFYEGTGDGNFTATANSITRDVTGNTYIGGTLDSGFGWLAGWYAKFNSAGVRVWAHDLGGATNSSVNALGTFENAVMVGGKTASNNGDMMFRRLQETGSPQWTGGYNGSANADDNLTGLVMDHDNTVFYGNSRESGSPYTSMFFTIRNIDLNLFGLITYPGLSTASDATLDHWGNIYIVGKTRPSETVGEQATLWKYYQRPKAVDDSYTMMQNSTLVVPAANGVLANDRNLQYVTVNPSNPSNGALTVDRNTGAFNYTPATNFAGTATFTYQLTRGSVVGNRHATVHISVGHGLRSLTVSPNSIAGGASTLGTVTMSGPATGSGDIVALSDNSSAITTPSSVTVAAGATSASFTISTSHVTANATRQVSATYLGFTRTASLTLRPTALLRLQVSPSTVQGGATATGSAFLDGPAPAGGRTVTLTDNSSAVSTPPSVTIAAGNLSASFTVTTSPVTATATRQVSGTMGSVTRSASITLTP